MLSSLLDLDFKQFVTLKVVKFLYMIGMGLIGLAFLGALIASFTKGFVAILVVLIAGPLIALMYLLFFRIWLELVVVIFRIAENTGKIADLQGGRATPPPVS